MNILFIQFFVPIFTDEEVGSEGHWWSKVRKPGLTDDRIGPTFYLRSSPSCSQALMAELVQAGWLCLTVRLGHLAR